MTAFFEDGPLGGLTLPLTRTPLYLRAVLDAEGNADALDQPGDRPAPGEAVHAYRGRGTRHRLPAPPRAAGRRGGPRRRAVAGVVPGADGRGGAGGGVMSERGWTPEEDRRLEGLRAAGLTRAEIAAETGRTEGSVQGRVRTLRLPLGCDAGGRSARGGSPAQARDVARRLDACEVAMILECVVASLDARPHATAYEGRLAALAAEAGAVLREARAEETEGRRDG
jgi:hypothetical protein